MNGTPAFPRLSDESLEEHRQVHFHLDQLSRALDDLDPATADEDRLRDLTARIESLKHHLQDHFRTEEESGLFQAVVDAVPQYETDVKRLAAQHERMIESLETARILAKRCEPSESALLKSDLGRILEMMREHEQEEDALVRRALQKA